LITLAKFIHLSLILVAGQPLSDLEPGHIQMKVAILGGGVHIVPIPQGAFLLNIGSGPKWTIYIPPGANFQEDYKSSGLMFVHVLIGLSNVKHS